MFWSTLKLLRLICWYKPHLTFYCKCGIIDLECTVFLLAELPWKLSKISAFWISCFVFGVLFRYFAFKVFSGLSHFTYQVFFRPLDFRAVYYRFTCLSAFHGQRVFTLPVNLFDFQVTVCSSVTLTDFWTLVRLLSVKLFQALSFSACDWLLVLSFQLCATVYLSFTVYIIAYRVHDVNIQNS